MRGDAAAFVRDLKAREGGDIYLCGGAGLAASLLAAKLIGTVVVKLNPLLLGAGIPLFRRDAGVVPLVLTGSNTYDTSVALLTYRVGG